MGFTTTKSKTSNNNNSEGWGMGFLLVFFPEEDHHHHHPHPQQESNNVITKKKLNLFSSSSLINRTNSSNLLHKAQSTLSICLILLFTTLLLFTLSTLPSATTSAAGAWRSVPRRHLSSRTKEFYSSNSHSNLSHALQGMGTLYRRGTRAMSDLIIAHVPESLTLHDFKLFLRLLYMSSLAARSDLLFIFPSKSPAFDNAILEENDSFLKILTQYSENTIKNRSLSERTSFDVTQFLKLSKKEKESGEPIWGRRIRSNFSVEGEIESTRPGYGSVIGFDVDELDPENSLSGFLDHIPMSLRRWACYPMLLGRVKRNFKHIMLVDVKEIFLLSDPFGRVRSQSPESVLLKLTSQSTSGKHGKRNSDRTQSTRVSPGIIIGGGRGVRRLSSAMLIEIVRAATQHKKKNSVSESSLFNQLVGNDSLLKNVNLIVSSESLPELSSLGGSHLKSGSNLLTSNYTLIRKGSNSNFDVFGMVMKHICSFPLDSKVYSDCLVFTE